MCDKRLKVGFVKILKQNQKAKSLLQRNLNIPRAIATSN